MLHTLAGDLMEQRFPAKEDVALEVGDLDGNVLEFIGPVEGPPPK